MNAMSSLSKYDACVFDGIGMGMTTPADSVITTLEMRTLLHKLLLVMVFVLISPTGFFCFMPW